MFDAIRAVVRRIHHAPWVCAAIVLAAGVTNWALFSAKKAEPEKEPEQEAAVFMPPGSFQEVAVPQEREPAGSWMDEPFSLEPSAGQRREE